MPCESLPDALVPIRVQSATGDVATSHLAGLRAVMETSFECACGSYQFASDCPRVDPRGLRVALARRLLLGWAAHSEHESVHDPVRTAHAQACSAALHTGAPVPQDSLLTLMQHDVSLPQLLHAPAFGGRAPLRYGSWIVQTGGGRSTADQDARHQADFDAGAATSALLVHDRALPRLNAALHERAAALMAAAVPGDLFGDSGELTPVAGELADTLMRVQCVGGGAAPPVGAIARADSATADAQRLVARVLEGPRAEAAWRLSGRGVTPVSDGLFAAFLIPPPARGVLEKGVQEALRRSEQFSDASITATEDAAAEEHWGRASGSAEAGGPGGDSAGARAAREWPLPPRALAEDGTCKVCAALAAACAAAPGTRRSDKQMPAVNKLKNTIARPLELLHLNVLWDLHAALNLGAGPSCKAAEVRVSCACSRTPPHRKRF